MHWKSLSRPKFEMVNGGGLLQVPTAFSGRYVEFVQSSAFGQLRTVKHLPGSGRSIVSLTCFAPSMKGGRWPIRALTACQ